MRFHKAGLIMVLWGKCLVEGVSGVEYLPSLIET